LSLFCCGIILVQKNAERRWFWQVFTENLSQNVSNTVAVMINEPDNKHRVGNKAKMTGTVSQSIVQKPMRCYKMRQPDET